MSLLANKKFFFILFSLFLGFNNLFALSINYKRPVQVFDSPIMLRSFSHLDQDGESWNFGPYGMVKKTEKPDIYLQIVGPGKLIYEHYGHVGFVIDFPSIGSVTFDYGVFDPSEEGFVDNFIHGNLYYYLYFHKSYSQDNVFKDKRQSYRYYLLDLTDEEKNDLIEFLIFNSKDERKWYLYDFFTDNCSTRARDVLNAILKDRLRKETISIPCGTFRTSIERAIRPYPLIEILYNIAQGSGQDKKINFYDAMFLPEYLELGVKDIYLTKTYSYKYTSQTKKNISLFDELEMPDDLNLLKFSSTTDKENYVCSDPSEIQEKPITFEYNYQSPFASLVRENDYKPSFATSVVRNSYLSPNYALYILIALVVISFNIIVGYFGRKRKWLLRLLGLLSFVIEFAFGILSLAIIYFSCFTIHDFIWYNYNLIFINPSLLISSIISLCFAILPKDRSRAFVVAHKILSVPLLFSLIFKVFYFQKNLYLILFFIFYYHTLISAFPHHNSENKFVEIYNFLKKFLKKLKYNLGKKQISKKQIDNAE